MGEDSSILVEDRPSDGALDGLARLGLTTKVSEEWDSHMGSFAVCSRAEVGSIGATACPSRCGMADRF